MRPPTDDKGVALAAAIYAIVILGAMLSVAFFIGLQDQRAGRNSLKVRNALAAAEGGAEQVVTDWNLAYNNIAIGDSSLFTGWLADSSGWYRGSVRRVGRAIFFVRSEGFSSDSTSRSEIGLLTNIRFPDIAIRAAFQTEGEVQIGGNAIISGIDTIPPGMDGCQELQDAAGLIIDDSTEIEYQGINHTERGDPPILEDDTTVAALFAGTWFDDLASTATITMASNTDATAYRIEPSVLDGECNLADLQNWGEPHVGVIGPPPNTPVPECKNYYPIVYSSGDLHLNQVRGQGVLLVDGDLYVKGQFRYYGVAIVTGGLINQGLGGHFFGGVIAGNVSDDSSRVAGNGQMYYSSCAIWDALSGSSPAELLRERAYTQIF